MRGVAETAPVTANWTAAMRLRFAELWQSRRPMTMSAGDPKVSFKRPESRHAEWLIAAYDCTLMI